MKLPDPRYYRKAAWLIGAILITASISGYFMGLRQTTSQISLNQPVSLAIHDPERRAILETNFVPVAVAYANQDWLRKGPNAGWKNNVENLTKPEIASQSLTNVTEAQRSQALRERSARRAFNGAPPVVPHVIAQDSSASCLACHGPGLAIKDKVASRISHTHFSSCTQCHVAASGSGLQVAETALRNPIAENAFVGSVSPSKGSRAWPQAPPTIPHATFMRNDCMSCHGPTGLFGLRTPHPDRQSCVQCHVPEAGLDQRNFSGVAAGEAALAK